MSSGLSLGMQCLATAWEQEGALLMCEAGPVRGAISPWKLPNQFAAISHSVQLVESRHGVHGIGDQVPLLEGPPRRSSQEGAFLSWAPEGEGFWLPTNETSMLELKSSTMR